MRKSLVSREETRGEVPAGGDWIDIDWVARVEITSEDPAFPIEKALGNAMSGGWRALDTGPQVIRLIFDKPTAIHRIYLHFVDRASERAQEFVLSAQTADGMHEVVRQQWNFSPNGTPEDVEDYKVNLDGVTALELRIDPDRSHDPKQSQHVASLQQLRLA